MLVRRDRGSRLEHIALALALAAGVPTSAAALTAEAVNTASFDTAPTAGEGPDPRIVKLQVLLDRANASPGVIDGYQGENVEKATRSLETISGLPVDGRLDAEVWSRLGGDSADAVLVTYRLTQGDLDYRFQSELPEDYSELARMDRLGFTSLEEMLAERFHMDVELFRRLNGDIEMAVGTALTVAQVTREPPARQVSTIEADKRLGEIRAYDDGGNLVVSYPATIGSRENPSPSGTHEIVAIAPEPVYYYQPSENFQQGDNTEPLQLPPGPNNPVGTVWIDLSEPTYGIHGSPEPAIIDKVVSHGCVRLTNWDAEELATLVEPGVTVRFVE